MTIDVWVQLMPPGYTKAAGILTKYGRTDIVERGATPETLLLWFHHLPWDYKLASGRTVWEEIQRLYDDGVHEAQGFVKTWTSLKGSIDDGRYTAVLAKLERQAADAAAWRDHCLSYFRALSQ